MTLVRRPATVELLAANDDSTYDVLITTPRLDRYRDRVLPAGAHLENYRRNPVVLWLHDYGGHTPAGGVPLGLSLRESASERGIESTFRFREAANDGDFVNVIRAAWEQRVLRGASIGFEPIRVEENDLGGLDYVEWELLEWSLVPIPANPDALLTALRTVGLGPVVAQPDYTAVYEELHNFTLILKEVLT